MAEHLAHPLVQRRRDSLYGRQYPIIMSVLARLAEQIPQYHSEVTLAALFGSVARMAPHVDSDTDLIALLDPSDALESDRRVSELSILVSRTIRRVVFREGHPRPEWGITMISGNADASDLDPDLLAVIGREGVLLYRRDDASVPPELERLTPFTFWKERVQQMLDEIRARRGDVDGESAHAGFRVGDRRATKE